MNTEISQESVGKNIEPPAEEDPKLAELRGKIAQLQKKLWRLERKLGLPKEGTKLLPKGFKSLDMAELLRLGRDFTSLLENRERQYRRRGAPRGRDGLSQKQRETVELLDELRELIRACGRVEIHRDPEDDYPFLPKGFRSMKGTKLDQLRKSFEDMHAKYDERLQMKLASEHERKVAWAKREAAAAEVEAFVRPFNDALDKLVDHPVFCRALAPKKISVFAMSIPRANEKMNRAKRKLREQLRRAWQSAHDRRITRLEFRDYVTQEGFGPLLP